MKKFATLVALTALTPFSFADVLAIKADAGLWRTDYDGELGGIPTSDLGYSDENSRFFHIAFEHPIPLVPNARLAYTDINAGRSIYWEDAQLIDSKIDLSHIDATAYYEILDNWVNIDLGISLRKFDGKISANILDSDNRISVDDVIPMGYALFEAELPFTGWSAGAELNLTDFDDYKISDYTLKLKYLFDAVVDLGFEAGYRNFSLTLDKSYGADLDLTGPYASLVMEF
ncbi:TIGR04219 family outer membrane beta-barrel protein [Gilvimarinus sp. DA14]|uniref:TIGR04219 family outer membrane beta-barrel protein n=1 Tax=Gilvimarinus sp. DA14 TaxID=2956798 RepID=UPI0020B6559C|nr:TIGR04219 family outer membrane beta-barrel protein [Gilvimarinus sp. DA14]UTF60993.1 TIGR04219 family outer membrane beta-barrel protein [Gilvimarinus sp. DA14]